MVGTSIVSEVVVTSSEKLVLIPTEAHFRHGHEARAADRAIKGSGTSTGTLLE